MLNQTSIIDKIQKLLALSKSDNEHEASLAMQKAQELLIKYNLDMSSISVVWDTKKGKIYYVRNGVRSRVGSASTLAQFKTWCKDNKAIII